MIDDKKFFDICYDEYRESVSEPDKLNRRHTFLSATIVVVGSSAIAFLWPSWSVENAVCLKINTLSFVATMTCLVFSIVFLIISLWPRPQERLDKIAAWIDWRESPLNEDAVSSNLSSEQRCEEIANVTYREMLSKLGEAQAFNQRRNDVQSKWWSLSFLSIVTAIIFLGIQLVSHGVLVVDMRNEEVINGKQRIEGVVEAGAEQSAG